MIYPKLITAPAKEPVSVEWLLSHLRFDIGDEDTLVDGFIKASRSHYEKVTDVSFISQTHEESMHQWWEDCHELYWWPLQTIVSVSYHKEGETEYTNITDRFEIDTYNDPGLLRLKKGQDFPSDIKDAFNSIKIQYVSGFGDDEEDVPEAIRHAIRLRASSFFKNRTDFEINQMLSAADALIQPFKRIRV